MALREGECFLVRRVADRGIDKNISGSRARGEDRRLVRRTADRGNDRVDSDSRDLKIKRLRQRVRDLEEIKRLRQRVRDLEEIKRLRQRVRYLELRREMRVKETESGTIVRDDVNEEEEHPFCHPHPWFFEPIYQKSLTDDELDSNKIVWDESDCEEEIGSVQVTTDESGKFVTDEINISYIEKNVGSDESLNMVASGSAAVVKGGNRVANIGVASPAKDTTFPFIEPRIMDELNIFLINKETNYMASPSFDSKIQIINIKEVDHNVDKPTKKMESFSIMGRNQKFVVGPIVGDVMDVKVALGWGLHGLSKVANGAHVKKHKNRDALHVNGLNKKSQQDKQNGIGSKNLSGIVDGRQMGGSVSESLVNKKWLSAPFDPGGTGLEPGESTREVELLRRVVMIINRNRVDVPFDPGGYGPKAKLEDEFFRRGGE